MAVVSAKPSRLPVITSIAVIVILAGAFLYTYETSSARIASESSSITSLQAQLKTLDDNITHQISLQDALQGRLAAANSTIRSLSSSVSSLSTQAASYSGQVSSQSSVISAQQSTIGLEVEQTIASQETINMPFNSTTTAAHFTVSDGGYLQISGTSNTEIIISLCYGATSLQMCENSYTYYQIDFGYGGATFNAPLMPGPVWIVASCYDAGTATLTITEWT